MIIWDTATGRRIASLSTSSRYVDSVAFSADGRYVAASSGAVMQLWRHSDWTLVESLASMGSRQWATILPEGYYRTSGADSNPISLMFQRNGRLYPFEQFDLLLNRPDIVLERLGSANASIVAAYRQAYHRRLETMGVAERDAQLFLDLPTMRVTPWPVPVYSKSRRILIHVSGRDTNHLLNRVNLVVTAFLFLARGDSCYLRQRSYRARLSDRFRKRNEQDTNLSY